MFFGRFNNNADDTFVALEINNGFLATRVKICSSEFYLETKENIYSNGDQHLVRLFRNEGQFQFYVDNILQMEVTVQTCDFNGDNLLFGGKLPATIPTGRRRRQALTSNTDINDFSGVSNYKGTLQDIQLDNYFLLLFNTSAVTESSMVPVQVSL